MIKEKNNKKTETKNEIKKKEIKCSHCTTEEINKEREKLNNKLKSEIVSNEAMHKILHNRKGLNRNK